MKKLFASDKSFTIVFFLAFVSRLLFTIYFLVPDSSDYSLKISFYNVFFAFCLMALIVSYRKHQKNVMKGLAGALLSAMVITTFLWIDSPDSYNRVFGFIFLGLNLILFVNHFIINSDHHSRHVNVLVNQIAALISALSMIVCNIFWIINYPTAIDIAFAIIGAISHSCLLIGLVCIESRLDSFRLERENAGWTEETGYPEGYVHEYQKQ